MPVKGIPAFQVPAQASSQPTRSMSAAEVYIQAWWEGEISQSPDLQTA